MRNKLIGLLSFSIILFSCGDSNETIRSKKNDTEIINQDGVYRMEAQNFVLQIVSDSAFLNFHISDSEGKELEIYHKVSISCAQKWFFFVDSTGTIWLQSSDRGLFRLKRTASSSYDMILHKPGSIVPEAVYKNLPTSAKSAYTIK